MSKAYAVVVYDDTGPNSPRVERSLVDMSDHLKFRVQFYTHRHPKFESLNEWDAIVPEPKKIVVKETVSRSDRAADITYIDRDGDPAVIVVHLSSYDYVMTSYYEAVKSAVDRVRRTIDIDAEVIWETGLTHA